MKIVCAIDGPVFDVWNVIRELAPVGCVMDSTKYGLGIGLGTRSTILADMIAKCIRIPPVYNVNKSLSAIRKRNNVTFVYSKMWIKR